MSHLSTLVDRFVVALAQAVTSPSRDASAQVRHFVANIIEYMHNFNVDISDDEVNQLMFFLEQRAQYTVPSRNMQKINVKKKLGD